MPLISIGEVRLNYVERGQGQTLLLVHGYPLDHSMWDGQLDGLADICRVIAPDLRGFGASDVTAGTVAMRQMADDLAKLLDALQILEPIVFCGLSMGGYVGWQFALHHRQRLAKLIQCDTRAFADSAEASAGRLTTAKRVLAEGTAVAAEALVTKLFAPETIQSQPAIVEATRQVMLGTQPHGIAAALVGMALRPDVTAELAKIDVPTLLICGQHDAISPPAEMQGIAKALPQGKYVEIHGAGHMAPLEQPAAVNQAMREFLR